MVTLFRDIKNSDSLKIILILCVLLLLLGVAGCTMFSSEKKHVIGIEVECPDGTVQEIPELIEV